MQDKLAFVVAPGICTIMGRFRRVGIIPLFLTKGSVTKEWDAPESNNTSAGTELTGNVPITRSGSSWASSALIWFRCPLATGAVFFWKGALTPGGLVGPWFTRGALGRLFAGCLFGHSREKCPGCPQAKHPPVGLGAWGLLNPGLALSIPPGRGAAGLGAKLGRGAYGCGLDGG